MLVGVDDRVNAVASPQLGQHASHVRLPHIDHERARGTPAVPARHDVVEAHHRRSAPPHGAEQRRRAHDDQEPRSGRTPRLALLGRGRCGSCVRGAGDRRRVHLELPSSGDEGECPSARGRRPHAEVPGRSPPQRGVDQAGDAPSPRTASHLEPSSTAAAPSRPAPRWSGRGSASGPDRRDQRRWG